MTDKEIALNILEQMGGANRVAAMTGMNNVLIHESGVSFRFKGSKVANYIKIILNPCDTYTVEFQKIRGMNCKMVKELSGAYCDMLKELFESTTGLYLSL